MTDNLPATPAWRCNKLHALLDICHEITGGREGLVTTVTTCAECVALEGRVRAGQRAMGTLKVGIWRSCLGKGDERSVRFVFLER
jgi:hypothetical protein